VEVEAVEEMELGGGGSSLQGGSSVEDGTRWRWEQCRRWN